MEIDFVDFSILKNDIALERALLFIDRYNNSKDELCIYKGQKTQHITQYITLEKDELYINEDYYINYLFNGDKILAYLLYRFEKDNYKIINIMLLCSNHIHGKGTAKILLDNIYNEYVTKNYIIKLAPATEGSLTDYYLNWKIPTFGGKTDYGGLLETEEFGNDETYGYLIYTKTGDISKIPRNLFYSFNEIDSLLHYLNIKQNYIDGLLIDDLQKYFEIKLTNSNLDKSSKEQLKRRIKNINMPFLKYYLESDYFYFPNIKGGSKTFKKRKCYKKQKSRLTFRVHRSSRKKQRR